VFQITSIRERRILRRKVARANSMLDIAAGFLGLVSVGIFVAHAVDTYRAQ
jgi:hypothetical protein